MSETERNGSDFIASSKVLLKFPGKILDAFLVVEYILCGVNQITKTMLHFVFEFKDYSVV